ncbi:hypothetical protein [Tropicibacter naphthalenivorans]|uniref:Porin n=1 Tax=Tropicibacter naphthalenivorans TaxID=441103 RepID=A0A0P1GJS7_9RHOB|nr:hypothetical protein [Tropicibacter naphthalenivorans]CUH82183.1 hypothetical protein TRN7648_03848 [Tropicibacter naphthalenivorans]SMD04990.1 hypothetical protein SAMN04488093_11256 [Tropicibacter naphthalenivorans]
MKRMTWAAAIAATAASPALAQDGPPPGTMGPPPGILGMMTVGKAGLLTSFYSDDAFGTAQFRIGQGRTTIGAAGSPFAPQTGYKDDASNVIPPLNGLKMLGDGKSFLRFGLQLNRANGAEEQVELNGSIARLDAQYITFTNPGTMLSFGVTYNKSAFDIVGAGTVESAGWGVRGDLLHKLSNTWGIATRAEYT